MTKEQKTKLARKNEIVKYFQEGKLSEAEFQEAMKLDDTINHINSIDVGDAFAEEYQAKHLMRENEVYDIPY